MNRFTTDRTFRAACAALSIIFAVNLVPPLALQAQPVHIDPLNTAGFGVDRLERAAQDARQSRNDAQFRATMNQARRYVFAEWEATVDSQIAAETAAAVQSDTFLTVEDYRRYIRESLELQKQSALTAWELEADRIIEQEHAAFLAGQSRAQLAAAKEAGADQVAAGEGAVSKPGSLARDKVARHRQEFENAHESRVAETLHDFGAAVEAITLEGEAYQEERARARLEFENGLAEIESYEATVRNAIVSAVDGLAQQLTASGLFHAETCDSTNVCTTDPETLNAAGLALDGLISELREGLETDAPLSGLARRLQSYLAERESRAKENRDHWDALIYEDRDLAGEGPQPGHGLNFDLYAGTITGSVIDYLRGNSVSLASARSSGHRVAQDFAGVDLRGESPIYAPYPLTGRVERAGQAWLADGAGEGALTYDAEGCGGVGFIICLKNVGAPAGHAEFTVRLSGTYRLYDGNAENNRDIWAGYVDELTAANQAWLTSLLPALDTWEQQAATFRAEYAAWQSEDAAAAIENEQARQSQIQELIGLRNQTLARLDDEHRAGRRKFETFATRINQNETRERIAAEAADFASKSFRFKGGKTIAEVMATTRRAAVTEPKVPNVSRPDFSAAQQVESAIKQTLAGSLNIAVSESLSDQARDLQRRASRRLLEFARASNDLSVTEDEVYSALVSMMDSYTFDKDPADVELKWSELDVSSQEEFDELRASVRLSIAERKIRQQFKKTEILENGSIRVSRDLSRGRTYLRAGGDAQNEADYIEELAEHAFILDGAGAARLSRTAGFFDLAYDATAALAEFDRAKAAYDKSVDAALAAAAEKIEAQNDLVEQMHARAVKHTRAQVEQAQQAASLAQALITGGTLQSWVEGQMRSQMAAEIEAKFGFPAGFMSGLLGGMKPHEAAISFFEGEAYSAWEKQLGLPAGLLALYAGEQKKKSAAKKSPTSRLAANLADMGTVAATIGGGIAGFMSGGGLVGMVSGAAAGYAASHAAQPAVTNFYERNPMAMDVAAVAATSVTGNPAVWYSYQAAKGYHQGGTLGAVTAMADTALIALSAATPFQASASYTHDGGFGTSAGVGVEGVASAGLSYSESAGGGVFVSLGEAVGPNLTFSATQRGGNSVAAGMGFGFGKENSSGVLSAGLSYNTITGAGANAGFAGVLRPTSETTGLGSRGSLGLTYNETDGVGARVGVTVTDNPAQIKRADRPPRPDRISPFNGSGVGVAINEREGAAIDATFGNADLGSYSFDTGDFVYNRDFANDAGRAFARAEYERQQAEELRTALDRGIVDNRDKLTDAEWEQYEKGELSPEQKVALLKEIERTDWLENVGVDDSSFGDSILGQLLGSAQILGETIIGYNSNEDGFTDDTGQYHVRICFVAGTLVRVRPGTGDDGGDYKRVENMRAGDYVLSWNETTGATSFQEVQQTFVRDANRIYVIEYENGVSVETTWNHPFWIEERGWIEARKLKAGMRSVTANGERLEIRSISIDDRPEVVYNFSVAQNETYFVSRSAILVHNEGDRYTADGKFAILEVIEAVYDRTIYEFGTVKSYIVANYGNENVDRFREAEELAKVLYAEAVLVSTDEKERNRYVMAQLKEVYAGEGQELDFLIIDAGLSAIEISEAAQITEAMALAMGASIRPTAQRPVKSPAAPPAQPFGLASKGKGSPGRTLGPGPTGQRTIIVRAQNRKELDRARTVIRDPKGRVDSNEAGSRGVEFVRKFEDSRGFSTKSRFKLAGRPTRRPDLYHSQSGRAIEVKNSAGRNVGVDRRIRSEVARDALLRDMPGSNYKPEWHFVNRPPSIGLRRLLKSNEIPYVIYK